MVSLEHNLGIPYLWIDSLCIIQDMQADKEYEMARMAQIYKDAYLTICAARSDDVNRGFLEGLSEPSTGLWPSLFSLPYSQSRGDDHS